jgi:hypothetical protein
VQRADVGFGGYQLVFGLLQAGPRDGQGRRPDAEHDLVYFCL